MASQTIFCNSWQTITKTYESIELFFLEIYYSDHNHPFGRLGVFLLQCKWPLKSVSPRNMSKSFFHNLKQTSSVLARLSKAKVQKIHHIRSHSEKASFRHCSFFFFHLFPSQHQLIYPPSMCDSEGLCASSHFDAVDDNKKTFHLHLIVLVTVLPSEAGDLHYVWKPEGP